MARCRLGCGATCAGLARGCRESEFEPTPARASSRWCSARRSARSRRPNTCAAEDCWSRRFAHRPFRRARVGCAFQSAPATRTSTSTSRSIRWNRWNRWSLRMDAELARALLLQDQRHVWHPFTQMQSWPEDEPLIIEGAEGNYLIDVGGNRYLDGVSSLWVNVHGHRKREIDEAIREQLGRVAHSTLLGLASVPSIQLAVELTRIAPPGLTRVFYSDSGSTAVEVAVKIAYQYWRQKGRPEKRKFVALREAYHGDTLGSVSVGGIELFHDIFRGLLFEVCRIPTTYDYRWVGEGDCGEACLAAAGELLARASGELAALLIEPLVQAAAGMVVQPRGFLARLAKLCREQEVLLICDEVATGFGRTGTMFAVEQEDVRPDLMCIAKGLSGGYLPLAATLTTERVHE